jgi:hypothetical protein
LPAFGLATFGLAAFGLAAFGLVGFARAVFRAGAAAFLFRAGAAARFFCVDFLDGNLFFVFVFFTVPRSCLVLAQRL